MPDACTLPTAERPLRTAEFEATVATSARAVHRQDATTVRVELAPDAAAAARVADLAVREGTCCSFFTFTLTTSGGGLHLDIAVPAGYVPVLDALAASLAGGRR